MAVLPFTDLSERHDQEYFSDGLAEEIINALAQVDGLRVTGRTSAFAFRDRMDDLRSLGRQLGVANVLVGSVRQDAHRVRVTAQLVRTADGRHLWSQTFERELTGVFSVQDEIASAVVAALEVELLRGRHPTSREYRTAEPEVYSQYLQGRRFMRRDTVAGSRLAAAAFQRALDLDPGYAPAWAGLSSAVFYGWGNVGEAGVDLEASKLRAEAAADRAVALAPELAEAYTARAFFRVNLRQDWAGGRADMERALALSPGDPEVMWRFARNVLGPVGRFEEAVALARRASQLDPMSPAPWSTLSALYLALERVELSRSASLRSLELLGRAGLGAHLPGHRRAAGAQAGGGHRRGPPQRRAGLPPPVRGGRVPRPGKGPRVPGRPGRHDRPARRRRALPDRLRVWRGGARPTRPSRGWIAPWPSATAASATCGWTRCSAASAAIPASAPWNGSSGSPPTDPHATTGRRGGLARSPRLTSWAKISIRLTTPGGYSLPSLSTATTGSPRARAHGP